jgi:hypothetical protein
VQLQQVKKRLLREDEGSVSAGAESSDNNASDNNAEKEEEEEVPLGPNALISLLDQHSELKKKAEGRD